MKTNELEGAALDWAVAHSEVAEFYMVGDNLCVNWGDTFDVRLTDYSPSTNWAIAGPIIDRERIAVEPSEDDGLWEATSAWHRCSGETPLIAAMRAYVTFKLGTKIELPKELQHGD